jgi:hypothetical protein
MFKLKFIEVSEIRMGSPLNVATPVLTGAFVPKLDLDRGFQDIGIVSPDGNVCYLIQWDLVKNEPAFRVVKIEERERRLLVSDRFSGACHGMTLEGGELKLTVWEYEKGERAVTVSEFYEPKPEAKKDPVNTEICRNADGFYVLKVKPGISPRGIGLGERVAEEIAGRLVSKHGMKRIGRLRRLFTTGRFRPAFVTDSGAELELDFFEGSLFSLRSRDKALLESLQCEFDEWMASF